MLRAMKIQLKPKLIKLFTLSLIVTACNSKEQRDFNSAQEALEKSNYTLAIEYFDKVILRSAGDDISVKAAREAARIAFFEIKDFNKAVTYNRQLILSSKDPEERKHAQKQIADIYFNQLNEYSKAIIEINKLLVMLNDQSEIAKYRMNVARAYYYQNNFDQAENEVDEFLRRTKDENQKFELIMLKGNIALAQKNILRAIEIYKGILANYPHKAQKENLPLTLAVCYEEAKDYKNAILTLEGLKKNHPMPEYIDVRIKRLQERLKNAPGAHGMRK